MNVEQTLIRYFRENNGEEVAADTRLVESGVIDSMGVMELIEFIEREYGLNFDLDDLTIENFATIRHIVQFINGKREKS